MKLGTIRPSKSKWSSPLHLVSKTANTWRACGDYKALNAVTKPDRYPVLHIQDITAVAMNTRIFTEFDLIRPYDQIPVEAKYIPKTAIVKPFGLFKFLRVPFGLRNAAKTLQKFIDQVLQDLPFVCAYIDNVLIAIQNEQEHISHVRWVFKRFQPYGVVINPLKCVFGQPEVTFFGHHISAGVIPHQRTKLKVFKIPQARK